MENTHTTMCIAYKHHYHYIVYVQQCLGNGDTIDHAIAETYV